MKIKIKVFSSINYGYDKIKSIVKLGGIHVNH